ncbi:MAG: hypothetical protein M1131_04090 [Actinobacteria bacterium]|nr:hypothetical protein [Actinomycetota bacterium]MCL6095385.1 hypothetical protein [Actinomycetota bacterium]
MNAVTDVRTADSTWTGPFSAFLMQQVRIEGVGQVLDLDAARAELLGDAVASTTWEKKASLCMYH